MWGTRMRPTTEYGVLVLVMTVLLMLAGCQQEGPAQQTRTQHGDDGAGQNPVERAAGSLTGTATTAIDRAQHTEDVLGQAAQRTADQVQQTTE